MFKWKVAYEKLWVSDDYFPYSINKPFQQKCKNTDLRDKKRNREEEEESFEQIEIDNHSVVHTTNVYQISK